MSRPLAPSLTEWIEACDRHGFQWHKPLRRELRALLSVARAARAHAKLTESAHRNGNQTCGADWRIWHAVDKLSRLSTPAGPRGRK